MGSSWRGSFVVIGLLRSLGGHLRNTRLQATFAAGFGVLFCLVATFTYVTFHLSEAPFHLGPVGLSFLFCSGVFVAQATATSFIGLAAERSKAQAVGIYVTCYYIGGSVGAEVPGLLWHVGGWTLCVLLVLFVQLLTVLLAFFFWAPPATK